MALKWKKIQMRQKAQVEQELQNRLSFLSGKGIEARKIDKDPLVKKLRAHIKAVGKRLKVIADNEKKMEDMAKIKAARAAAPPKEQGGKGEKPKKAAEEGKGKKIKGEKKAAPPKAQEGGKSQKAAEAPVKPIQE